jgi:hypothetical protein
MGLFRNMQTSLAEVRQKKVPCRTSEAFFPVTPTSISTNLVLVMSYLDNVNL